MKNMLSLILVLVLVLCAVGSAAETTYAAMSTEQLHTAASAIRNELLKRDLVAAENVVLVDQDGVQVYMTGNNEIDWIGAFAIEVVVVNNSTKKISILSEIASINGWTVYMSGVTETGPGKKQKGTLSFDLDAAGISSIEEIEEVEIELIIYDSDAWESVSKTPSIVIQF